MIDYYFLFADIYFAVFVQAYALIVIKRENLLKLGESNSKFENKYFISFLRLLMIKHDVNTSYDLTNTPVVLSVAVYRHKRSVQDMGYNLLFYLSKPKFKMFVGFNHLLLSAAC